MTKKIMTFVAISLVDKRMVYILYENSDIQLSAILVILKV